MMSGIFCFVRTGFLFSTVPSDLWAAIYGSGELFAELVAEEVEDEGEGEEGDDMEVFDDEFDDVDAVDLED